MTETVTALSESLFQQLQNEPFALLHTIDAEAGSPTSSAVSWIYPVNESTLRFAIDGRSRLAVNMLSKADVSVTVFVPGSIQTIYGLARLVKDSLDEVPFKLVCFDIEIGHIRDAMFYGSRLSAMPEYEKTYDKRAADKLDRQVFAAMKKA